MTFDFLLHLWTLEEIRAIQEFAFWLTIDLFFMLGRK